jgi:hypothetical protein
MSDGAPMPVVMAAWKAASAALEASLAEWKK